MKMKVRVSELLESGGRELLGVIANNSLDSFDVTGFLLHKEILNREEKNGAEVEKIVEHEAEFGWTSFRLELPDGTRQVVFATLTEME
jgi:hypothetical protein